MRARPRRGSALQFRRSQREGRVLSTLLLDAGNTRLKWAPLRAGKLGRVRALNWDARSAPRVARKALATRRAQLLVCSVAGAAFERDLRRAARRTGLPAPRFVRSARRAAGVRNGYVEPWRLGADRWVAMLGARALYPGRALCIVDVGTALTLDLLDAAGQHRGGLLVPGPTLMVAALLQETAGIRARASRRRGEVQRAADLFGRGAGAGLFGRSTRAGLVAGSTLACAALIERSLREARRSMRARPLLLLAGGGAARVAPLLGVACHRVDDLVLRGLALLAGSDSR